MGIASLFQPHISGKGVAWNSLIKALTIALTVLIELFYVKFLLYKLGADLFGVISLTTNTILIVSLLTYVILNTMGRFVSIDVHRGNNSAANQAFNVGFLSLLVFSVVCLLPASATFSWYAPQLFIVPVGCETATRVLFAAVLFSFILTSLGSALSVGTFVYNRLDLVDLHNFFRILISRGLSVILINFAGFGLYGVSVGLFVASLIGLIVSVYLWRQLSPNLVISPKFWEKKLFFRMSDFFVWIFIRQFGGRALVYLDLVVVNRLYGARETGLYGIAFFFSSKLRFLTGTFSGLFNPIIFNRYAKGDIDGMLDIACRGMRVIGVVFALPVGLLCGFYRPIFTVWVGKGYEYLYIVAFFLTVHISVNTTTYLLSSILSASNNVRTPSIVSIGFAIANVVLAVLLGWPSFGLGMAGIAVAGLVTLTLNNAIFTPYYVGLVLKRSPRRIYKTYFPGILGLIPTFLATYLLSSFKFAYSLPGLIFAIIAISFAFLPFAWFVLISSKDREWILSMAVDRLHTER